MLFRNDVGFCQVCAILDTKCIAKYVINPTADNKHNVTSFLVKMSQ
jgi:hypothetical protein